MSFWTNSNIIIPKQSHRWKILVGQNNQVRNNLTWFAKAVDRPSYQIKNVEVKYLYSHVVNFPTRPTWNPIKIEFYDTFMKTGPTVSSYESNFSGNKPKPVDFKLSTTSYFFSLLRKSGYFSADDFTSTNSGAFKAYPFKNNLINALLGQNNNLSGANSNSDKLIIEELDGDGMPIEHWEISKPLITSVNFNTLDYTSDNIMTATIEIVYDWAKAYPVTANGQRAGTTR